MKNAIPNEEVLKFPPHSVGPETNDQRYYKYYRYWYAYAVLTILAAPVITAVIFNILTAYGAAGFFAMVATFDGFWVAFFGLITLLIFADLFPFSFRDFVISLAFFVVFTTLLLSEIYLGSAAVAAIVAALVSIVGFALSEIIRRVRYPRWTFNRSLIRVLFYTGQHAIAASLAGLVYVLIANQDFAFLWDLNLLNVEAATAYFFVYPLISRVLVWPHEFLMRNLLMPPDEEHFSQIGIFATALMLPVLAIVVYFLIVNVRVRGVAFGFGAGVFLVLFLIFLFVMRSYASIETEEKRLKLRDQLRRELGVPANMSELMNKLNGVITKAAVEYQWGAFYSTDVGGNIGHLRATLKAGGSITAYEPLPEGVQKYVSAAGRRTPASPGDENETAVAWPRQFKKGEGDLGTVLQTGIPYSGLTPAAAPRGSSSEPHVPPQTAFLYISVPHQGDNIGVLALTRPKRRFKERDLAQVETLLTVSGDTLYQVQQVENELAHLYDKVKGFATDPEGVQRAIQILRSRRVDVAKMLNAISNYSFQNNLRSVLKNVAEGEKSQGTNLNLEDVDLENIYERVRDETPGMPPLDDGIMRHLRMVPASLSLAFSFRYIWPKFDRGPEFTELYSFFAQALEVESALDIAALAPQLAKAKAHLEHSGLSYVILWQVNRLEKITLILEEIQARPRAEQRERLGEAIEALQALSDAIHKELNEKDPERIILPNLIGRWRQILTHLMDATEQGGALLELSLLTNHALPLEIITVGMELKNIGLGAAHRVVLELLPDEAYQIVDPQEPYDLGTLMPDSRREVFFQIKACADDQLRLRFEMRYRDKERKAKREVFADILHLSAAPPPYVNIENPYMTGTPLPEGSHVFFGREEIFDYIDKNCLANGSGQQALLLIGQRRIGKTSILRQLPHRLGNRGYIHVFFDCQGIGDLGTPNFFLSLCTTISDCIFDQTGVEIDPPDYAALKERPMHVFEREFLAQIWAKLADHRLLIAIDEYEVLEKRVANGHLDPYIIGYLRSLMQHNGRINFIFVGTHVLEDLTKDYWHHLFHAVRTKRVGLLDRQAAERLIREPVRDYNVRYDDLAVEQLWRSTGGHPLFLQIACDHLIDMCQQYARNYITIRDVDRVIKKMLQPNRTRLEYIWDDSNEVERAAMAGLAAALVYEEHVTTDAVLHYLQQAGHDEYRRTDIRKALRRLSSRHIVTRHESAHQAPGYYTFVATLYQLWIRKHHPLD